MQLTVQMVDGEPRALDLMVAGLLEFDRPSNIRRIIERNQTELERYGSLLRREAMIEIGKGAQRESAEYWLNEAQALLICMRSDTAKAPDAREEIIRVFMAWRRGELVPASQITLTAIGELFDEKLAPMKMEVARLDDKMTLIYRRVDDIVPRREFSKEAQRQFRWLVVNRYNNECPCCRQVTIDCEGGEGGEDDHYLGRELSGPEHGWRTCKKCNLKMANDALFKASRRPAFDVYQELRRQQFGNGSPLKPRKGSPKSSSGDQGEMF